MKVNPRRQAEVYTVTNAPRPMSEDIGYRQRRYLISMGIRTVCFIGSVITAMAGAPLWIVGLMVVGALFLPYISVIFANGGREPTPTARYGDPVSPHHKQISGQGPEIGS
ncbi:DUF3099 domain-containing protein [Actinomadura barringtoniae]|uniref:DUF3099 domain-containing protein n=1 Tax=Actinomadura barringtoniae TaxID=1427535 RepID=A0A939PJU6_9ACTN|nr:DUF3099 domain-containing protein [Actinomadura barringtoniae]MBO2449896.1 DUF3099 domain-containing protein [Actinomadura barringtoniae]